MSGIVTALLSAMSTAALSVFARLITKSMFERLFEALIKQGVQYLADHTDSPLLDQVAEIVKKELEESDGGKA